MAAWPALVLARAQKLSLGRAGVLAGGAVLLAQLALLSQSRGSLYATPVDAHPGLRLAARTPAHIRGARPRRGWHRRRGAGGAPGGRSPKKKARARRHAQRGRAMFRPLLSPGWWWRWARLSRAGRSAPAAGAARHARGRGDPLVAVLAGGSPWPATRSRASKGLAELQGRLRVGHRGGSRLIERAGKLPLRLLPGGPGRIRRPSARRDRRGQLRRVLPRARTQRRDAPLPPQRRDAHARADRPGGCAAGARRPRGGAARGLAGVAHRRSPGEHGRRGGPRRLRLLDRARLLRLVLGVRGSGRPGVRHARARLCARAPGGGEEKRRDPPRRGGRRLGILAGIAVALRACPWPRRG